MKQKTNEQYIKELKNVNPNTRPHDLIQGKGCPICKASHGEKEIETILQKYNIKYYVQHRFDDCKYKRVLPFDFYLPDYNMCIEFQGRQHYEAVDYFGGELVLKETQKRDNIKKQYCLQHNIDLLYISHFEFNTIENILYDFLFNKQTQTI